MFNSWVNDKRIKALVLKGIIIILLILSYSHYSPFTLLFCSKFLLWAQSVSMYRGQIQEQFFLEFSNDRVNLSIQVERQKSVSGGGGGSEIG